MRQRKGSIGGTFSSFDGTEIYYEISGTKNAKETLLFLHGLGGNLRVWDPQVDYFVKQDYRTITMDLRGHGLSARPKKNKKYKMEYMAKDIAFFFKAYGNISNVTIVGWCLGGIVSLLLTGAYGIKPKHLILIATNYRFSRYVSFFQHTKVMDACSYALHLLPFSLGKAGHMPVDKFRGSHYLSPRRIATDIFYTTPESYLAICQNLFTFNGRKLLGQITSPTLIIHGTKDIVFSKKTARTLHAQIPHSQLVFIKNANHILVLNHPRTINTTIDRYLTSQMSQSLSAQTISL